MKIACFVVKVQFKFKIGIFHKNISYKNVLIKNADCCENG